MVLNSAAFLSSPGFRLQDFSMVLVDLVCQYYGYHLHFVTDVALFVHDMSVAQGTPWVRLS